MEDDKLGMTKEVIATKVLPFLFPLSIENGLTLQQYNVTMGLIRQLISKVEEEHKVKLEQLNSLQDEQRYNKNNIHLFHAARDFAELLIFKIKIIKLIGPPCRSAWPM